MPWSDLERDQRGVKNISREKKVLINTTLTRNRQSLSGEFWAHYEHFRHFYLYLGMFWPYPGSQEGGKEILEEKIVVIHTNLARYHPVS